MAGFRGGWGKENDLVCVLVPLDGGYKGGVAPNYGYWVCVAKRQPYS
jgi:hypothetical protein